VSIKIVRGNWKLRDLALSELVPIRVRNVVAEQPEDTPLLLLELPEALRRWDEVEFYLLNCRNMGEGSCQKLLAALTSIVKDDCGQPSLGDSVPVVFKTLGEFSSSRFAPVRIRNMAGSLSDSQGLLCLTPDQALDRWYEIEDYFLHCKAVGESTCSRLRQALEGYVGVKPSAMQVPLIQYIVSSASGVSDLIRTLFLGLHSDHPIQNLRLRDAMTHLPILRYYLSHQPSIGPTKIVQFENLMRELGEHNPPDDRSPQDTLFTELAEHPLAFQSASLIFGLFERELSSSQLGESIRDCTVIDVLCKRELFTETKKQWISDLVTAFLFESTSWFEDISGTLRLCLSEEGRSHLELWAPNRDASMSPEWICIHVIVKLSGIIRSSKFLGHFSESIKDRNLLSQVANGNALCRESTRSQFLERPILPLLLQYLGTSVLSDHQIELSTDDLFDLLLSGVDARHKEILLSKFAPTAGSPLTFEETGQLFNVTRERIRQIIQKWMQRIETDGRAEMALKHVKKVELAWIQLVNTAIVDSQNDLAIDDLANDFPHQEKLILAACNDSPKKWLERNSKVVDGKVHLIHEDDERIREAEDFLQKFLALEPKLPQLTSRIPGAPLHLKQTVFATKAAQSGKVAAILTPAGVVLAENSSAINRRLALVMSVFDEKPDWVLSDQQLWNAIWSINESSASRSQWRVFTNSIRAAPTCFRKLSRIGWMDLVDCSLSESYNPGRGPLLTPRVKMGSREMAMGDGNQRGRLYSLISESGALYAKECIDLWSMHDDMGTGTSAGFLLDDPFFVICHPGMTGCLDDHGELVNSQKIRDRLQNKESLQTYLLFRQGGFGPLDFPAWDRSMLELWQEWADINIREDVAKEVIAQLQNDIEICQDIELRNSAMRVATHDFGFLESPRRPADSMIPPFEDIFQLAAVATRFGFLNYYLVNCCTGRHWYSHRSISWMAFLVSAGVIDGADHWQKMHRVTDIGRAWLFRLVKAAMEHEVLNWSKVSLGQELLELTADTWRENTRDSWVVPSEFTRLLVAMMDPVRRNANTLLNAEIFQLSNSRKVLPQKEAVFTGTFVDPFLDSLLDDAGD
jgi:hypothetical protein